MNSVYFIFNNFKYSFKVNKKMVLIIINEKYKLEDFFP